MKHAAFILQHTSWEGSPLPPVPCDSLFPLRTGKPIIQNFTFTSLMPTSLSFMKLLTNFKMVKSLPEAINKRCTDRYKYGKFTHQIVTRG